MKDIEKRLDGVFERFSKGQEGDAHANNSGLIALAYGLAHLGDKLEKAANALLKATELRKEAKGPDNEAPKVYIQPDEPGTAVPTERS